LFILVIRFPDYLDAKRVRRRVHSLILLAVAPIGC
jgi:hypothetical protein